MVPQKINSDPATQASSLIHHGLRISKHAARVIIVSSAVTGLSFLVVNAALLTMQISSLPVFLKTGSINLSLHTPNEAKVLLASYSHSQTLNLKIQNKAYKTPAEAAGIKLNTAAILASMQHPTGWNKIPLIYAVNNHHRSFPLQYSVNNTVLTKYISGIKLPQEKSAVNATIIIPQNTNQAAYISPAASGYLFTPAKIAAQVSQSVTKQRDLQVVSRAQVLQPSVIANELNSQLNQTNTLLQSNLTITNGTKSYKLTAKDLRQIITIVKDSRDIPKAAVNRDMVSELLRSHSDTFYIAPSDAKVSLVDGQQTSTVNGTSGQAIDIDTSTTSVISALQNHHTKQTLAMSKVDANTSYLKSYTATSTGLTALVNDFVATHPGSYQVAAIELNGDRSAYYNQNQQTIAASTYKVFVAFVALQKIQQGSLSFSSQTSLGSLDYCLQQMIKFSDNNCAEAILDLMGWQETQNIITLSGFTTTQLNLTGDGYSMTSANDLASFLKELYNGQLLNGPSTTYLLNLMEQQIYRTGIPAGSHGAVVADKVGQLYNYFHDAGIVYSPKSNYVLVVMSNSGTYSGISALADQVYSLFNQ